MTWRRVLAIRVSHEVDSESQHRTVHLIPPPRTESLEPGRSVERILVPKTTLMPHLAVAMVLECYP